MWSTKSKLPWLRKDKKTLCPIFPSSHRVPQSPRDSPHGPTNGWVSYEAMASSLNVSFPLFFYFPSSQFIVLICFSLLNPLLQTLGEPWPLCSMRQHYANNIQPASTNTRSCSWPLVSVAFWDTVLLCSLHWPGSCYLPALVPQVLELHVCATTPSQGIPCPQRTIEPECDTWGGCFHVSLFSTPLSLV